MLNKQYSKLEYDALHKKVITHMQYTGEYGNTFPMSLSPFAYNDSVAMEFQPLTKDQVLARKLKWHDEGASIKGRETMPWKDVPSRIQDVTTSISEQIFACTKCGKNYKFVWPSVKLYKKFGVPLPEHCPACRRRYRAHEAPAYPLYDRICAKCKQNTRAIYAPERPEIVYCEKCYQESLN